MQFIPLFLADLLNYSVAWKEFLELPSLKPETTLALSGCLFWVTDVLKQVLQFQVFFQELSVFHCTCFNKCGKYGFASHYG